MMLAVTFFGDHRAQMLREEFVDPAELAQAIQQMTAGEKKRLPWLKLAKFGNKRSPKGSLRHDANVTALSGVEGDIDNGDFTLDEAVESPVTTISVSLPTRRPATPRNIPGSAFWPS